MTEPIDDGLQEAGFQSSLDNSHELYRFWWPQGVPEAVVVGLHTWSADRFNQGRNLLPLCQERGWGLVLPEFRGPNLTSNPRALEAGGGPLARRDIVDALRHALATQPVAEGVATFLVGGSGGGHMSLQVAGREEWEWDAVSSWCPITDLSDWQRENPAYRPHIEAVCGGAPGSSPEVDARYREKSPIHIAEALAKVRLQLSHGRHDASVPYSHGWKMALAIEAHHPRAFYFHLFDGGHEAHNDVAFRFFDETLRRRSGVELTG